MAVFAGVFPRSPAGSVPESLRKDIERSLVRNEEAAVESHYSQLGFLAVATYPYGPRFGRVQDGNESLIFLAGDPLVSVDGHSAQEQTEALHRSVENGRAVDWLRKSRGEFAVASLHATPRRLVLTNDKLGIRPLYCASYPEWIVYATSLRIFEELGRLPKTMCLRAVNEISVLGYALGRRTPYVEISALRGGEIHEFGDQGESIRPYWRWDRIERDRVGREELLQTAYDRFSNSVGLRLGDEKTAVALLSGGLDSRCVVTELWRRGVEVHTYTSYGSRAAQDRVFAARYARRLGTHHTESPHREDVAGEPLRTGIYHALAEITGEFLGSGVERPRHVWSGEGGSVGLGGVYLTEDIRAYAGTDGSPRALAETYLRSHPSSVIHSLFRGDLGQQLEASLVKGVHEEIDRIDLEDPLSRFWLFLMCNDQHRHLEPLYENLDAHGCDVRVPYFDSEFLELVLSQPASLFVRHGFYHDWLDLFPESTTSVPWQTYPGHEPCPLPIDEGLKYQWSARPRGSRLDTFRRMLELCSQPAFPGEILDRSALGLRSLLHVFGWDDYAYSTSVVTRFSRHWKVSGGKYRF